MSEMTHLERFRAEVPRPGLADLRDQERRLLTAIAGTGPDAAGTGPSGPVRRRGAMPRLVAGLAVTTVLAVAAVIGFTLVQERAGTATSYANAAIDIELRGDEYVATIKDPFADHALYSEGFKALGLDVGLQLVPASPTRVGDIVRYGSSGTNGDDKLGGGLSPEGCAPGSPAAR
nr:hypothetical protein GCM10020093_067890 [Planobispora longispora]